MDIYSQPKIDCHVHVFDPARFPYPEDNFYKPGGHEIGTAVQLGHTLDAHGVRHALLVGPNSGYGFDNRCLLDAIAHSAGRYKGVAVVPLDTSPAALHDLQAAGVVGVTLNVALLGVDYYRAAGPLLERLRQLGMWAQVQVQFDELVALQPLLVDSGVHLLFDHCGRPNPQAGVEQAGFQALLSLAEKGRAVVKISGLVKASTQPFPHPDAWPFVQALVDTYTPESLVWASDWPFLRAPARTDYGPLLDVLGQLVPDAAAQRAMLWDTPRRLFGFGG